MRSILLEWLPVWARGAAEVLFAPRMLWLMSTASVVMFVASLVLIPWAIRHLPADYFTRRDTLVPELNQPPVRAIFIKLARNLLGALLLVAGVLMLFLPGQGLLTIFVSLFLIDFPKKRRLQQRIIVSPPVFGAINRLRQRAGREPLEHP